jgi:ABC-type antimicrobial peptide transport system permease subunit
VEDSVRGRGARSVAWFRSEATGQTIAAFLFGVTLRDPLTLAGVVVLVVAAAGAGSVLPIRRALAIDPVAALQDR